MRLAITDKRRLELRGDFWLVFDPWNRQTRWSCNFAEPYQKSCGNWKIQKCLKFTNFIPYLTSSTFQYLDNRHRFQCLGNRPTEKGAVLETVFHEQFSPQIRSCQWGFDTGIKPRKWVLRQNDGLFRWLSVWSLRLPKEWVQNFLCLFGFAVIWRTWNLNLMFLRTTSFFCGLSFGRYCPGGLLAKWGICSYQPNLKVLWNKAGFLSYSGNTKKTNQKMKIQLGMPIGPVIKSWVILWAPMCSPVKVQSQYPHRWHPLKKKDTI